MSQNENILHNKRIVAEVLFSLFLDLNLRWNVVLKEQFNSAKVEFHNCGSSWFFDFYYDRNVSPIQTTQRVPVIIEICEEFVVTGNAVKRLSAKNSFWIEERSHPVSEFYANPDVAQNYTGIYMHFNDGIVCEIEVVDWNGKEIEETTLFSEIAIGQRMYRIAENKLIEEIRVSMPGAGSLS